MSGSIFLLLISITLNLLSLPALMPFETQMALSKRDTKYAKKLRPQWLPHGYKMTVPPWFTMMARSFLLLIYF